MSPLVTFSAKLPSVNAANWPTIRMSARESPPSSARSMRILERYGTNSASAVLTSDSASTAARRRQCGATYPSARRRSRSSNGKQLPRRSGRAARRRHEDDVRHVGAEVHGPEQLEVGGRVAVDGAAGGGDVELAAVRSDDQPHARPAGELGLADDAARLEIERPELVVADFTVNAVRALAIRREPERHRLARTEGIEVELAVGQIHSGDAHLRPVIHRVI